MDIRTFRKGKYLSPSLLLIIGTFIAISGCQKNFEPTISSKQNKYANFFETPKKVDEKTQHLIAALKRYDSSSNFISTLPDDFGSPVWNKVFFNRKKNVANKSGADADERTAIVVPVSEDNEYLSGVILLEEQNDTITSLKSFDDAYFHRISHGTTLDLNKAKEALGLFLLMDYKTFGTKEFDNIPKILFPNDLFHDSSKLTTRVIIDTSGYVNGEPSGLLSCFEISWLETNCGTPLNPKCIPTCDMCTACCSPISHSIIICSGGGAGGGSGGGGGTGGGGTGGGGSGGGGGGGYGDGFDPPPCGGRWYRTKPCNGGGGGTVVYSQHLQSLISLLNLDQTQINYLVSVDDLSNNNKTIVTRLLSYLENTTQPVAKANEIANSHLNKFMGDIDYMSFVNSYETNNPSTDLMWWENDPWLSQYGGVSYGNWAIEYLTLHPNVSFSTFQNQFMTPLEGVDQAGDDAFWDDPIHTYTHQTLPSLVNFSDAFPKRSDRLYDTPEKLYNSIGGAVKANGYTGPLSNTCAARVSKALNYSGVIIPDIPGKTFLGNDGKYYFLGAENMNTWMRKTFGCSNPNTAIGEYLNTDCIHISSAQITPFGSNLPLLLSSVFGIYSFVSSDPNWASGHIDIIMTPWGNPNPICDNGQGGCHFDGPIEYIDVWNLH